MSRAGVPAHIAQADEKGFRQDLAMKGEPADFVVAPTH